MSWGFRSINDASYVQIDSDSPRLCHLYSGNYGGSNYTVNINFPAPVKTAEPPCIFIRPSTTSATELYRRLIINGSAGNWTGFTVESSNVTYQPTGKWFVAVFASLGKSDFGMRLFDSAGAIIYDTGAPPVIVTKVSTAWAYAGSIQMTLGRASYWRTPMWAEEDEYIMINPFSRPIFQAGGASGGTCGLRINYSGGYTEIYSVSNNPWTNIGYIPAVFARLFTK